MHSGPTNLVAHQYTAWNTSITNILFLAAICSLLFAVLPPIIVTALACVWRGLRLRWVYIALTVLGLAAYASLCLLPLLVPNERMFPLIRALTSRIGVFPFIGLFLLAIFSVAALSSIAFDTWRIPVFSLLVLTALVFSVMGLNSDFDVRLLGSGKTEMKPPPIATAFRQWLNDRKDYTQYRGANPPRPYPVYLVAMAGGGAYAGFHSSYFLSRLFKSCPKLRHHTFAISAVSGGALGAALIATEAARKPGSAEIVDADAVLKCNVDPGLDDAGPDLKKIEKFFSLDHFGFLVWARLYPDMLRRLLWFKVPRLNSDTLFEQWFNANWKQDCRGSASTEPLRFGRSAIGGRGDAPVLFFNVTNTETGRAEAVSPLHFPRNLPSRKNSDMRLITGGRVQLPLSDRELGGNLAAQQLHSGARFRSRHELRHARDNGHLRRRQLL